MSTPVHLAAQALRMTGQPIASWCVCASAHSCLAGTRTALAQCWIEYDLAVRLPGLHEPVRIGSARKRQDSLDLHLDLARGRRGKAFRNVGFVMAGLAFDGDPLVVEVREVDQDVRPGVSSGGDQPPVKTDGAECL